MSSTVAATSISVLPLPGAGTYEYQIDGGQVGCKEKLGKRKSKVAGLVECLLRDVGRPIAYPAVGDNSKFILIQVVNGSRTSAHNITAESFPGDDSIFDEIWQEIKIRNDQSAESEVQPPPRMRKDSIISRSEERLRELQERHKKGLPLVSRRPRSAGPPPRGGMETPFTRAGMSTQQVNRPPPSVRVLVTKLSRVCYEIGEDGPAGKQNPDCRKATIGHGNAGKIYLIATEPTPGHDPDYEALKVVSDLIEVEKERIGTSHLLDVVRMHPEISSSIVVPTIVQLGSSDRRFITISKYYEAGDGTSKLPAYDPSLWNNRGPQAWDTLWRQMRRALELGVYLFRGLSHLHRYGWIHGDVKPANLVFLSSDPDDMRVRLIDPGQMRRADARCKEDVDQVDAWFGTNLYKPGSTPAAPGMTMAPIEAQSTETFAGILATWEQYAGKLPRAWYADEERTKYDLHTSRHDKLALMIENRDRRFSTTGEDPNTIHTEALNFIGVIDNLPSLSHRAQACPPGDTHKRQQVEVFEDILQFFVARKDGKHHTALEVLPFLEALYWAVFGQVAPDLECDLTRREAVLQDPERYIVGRR